MSSRTTVLSILGTQLDSARPQKRFDKWRPTFSLFQHEDLQVDCLELLYPGSHQKLAEQLRDDILNLQPDARVNLHLVDFEDPWDFEEVFRTLHEFSRSYSFATSSTDYLIHITTGSHVQQICLFLLTESRHLPGRLIQTGPPGRRRGGHHPGSWYIIDLDLSRYDALAARFASEQQEGQEFLKAGIETCNADFNRMIERIERVAIASTAPILLSGPTGAGKTRLARRIYELKRRREQLTERFVEVNCATLRGDQAMSALFGHTKGAFTGAASARRGLLQSADGGLLFLDEIGELGMDEQAMLLRAIEEQVFLPVGSDTEQRADFQLIAGTNKDLTEAVSQGQFREDLLARINLWTFQLPGLAERSEDIEPNLTYELDRYSDNTGQRVTMTREARTEFLAWAQSPRATWCGNFRDLNAAVLRMATLAEQGRIGVQDVRDEISRLSKQWSGAAGPFDAKDVLRTCFSAAEIRELDLIDRVQLAVVIRICRESDSMAEAGRQLFAASRQRRSTTNDSDRVRKFLARFGLDWKSVRSRRPE